MWLSKITLLSFTNSNRGPQVLGFFQLTLFIRALSLKEKSPNRIVAALVALVSAAVPAFLAWGFTKYDTSGCVKEYFDVAWKIVGVWMLLVVLFYLLFCSHRKKYTAAVIGCCVVVMASSCWINPIAQGTGAVTKSETMQTIRDIVKSDPSAIWLTVDLEYPGTNIPAMAGADCFNTTQTMDNAR